MGEGLLVHKAVQMQKAGKSMEETAAWVKENIPRLIHIFTVDDLNHLYRGGRVSRTAAVIGSVVGIKPILHVDDEGHLIPIQKVRGRSVHHFIIESKKKELISALFSYFSQIFLI